MQRVMNMTGDATRDSFAERVLDHLEHPYHRGTAERPTHRQRLENPQCGDVVVLELVVDDTDRIAQAWFQAAGCTICQSATSLLTRHVEGLTLADLERFTAQDMLDLFGFPLTPQRQNCCLLPWRTLRVAAHARVSPVSAICSSAAAEPVSAPRASQPSHVSTKGRGP